MSTSLLFLDRVVTKVFGTLAVISWGIEVVQYVGEAALNVWCFALVILLQ